MVRAVPIEEFLSAPGVILDVRSPSEYTQGHIPGAISFPLFTDQERAQVGTCYKHQGRDAAVELGFALSGGKLAGFIADAKRLAGSFPNPRQVRVHCWRGGMRSGAVAWALEMAGFDVTTLISGYKAFRRWSLDQFSVPQPIAILGGMTGTGKTDILHALAQQGAQVLDLEAIANHRGSSFGALGLPPQPSNEQFENEIAVRWANFDPHQSVWIEAESKRIGLCRIPEALFWQMERAPVLEITRPRSERLAALVEVYGTADCEALVTATKRIERRLGGQHAKRAIDLIYEGKLAESVDIILNYYDKTYTYDLQRRAVSIYPIDVTGLLPTESAMQLLKQAAALTSKINLNLRQSETVLR
ncbi:tRNA 2-selenouridine(34) synthase MnmH [Phormidium tenue FACHB-886]|nr:tRNA 2-selenouridine(34) synthase MnmH [Phormidium tenue FACHB-886]